MIFRERRGARVLLAGAALCALFASGLSGCVYEEDCGDDFLCTREPRPTSPCDGLDPDRGPAVDGCGVFVSRAQGSDGNAGTRGAPLGTLQRAIVEAQARGVGRVYACGEEFEEAVALPSGVAIWGGRECWAPDGAWRFGGPGSLTVVAPGTGRVPMRVYYGSAGEGSLVHGVRLEAADALGAGGSSIAMIVSDAVVTVRASEIVAGDGAAGENGEDAPAFRAKTGAPGNPGLPGCQADTTLGPSPAITMCEDGERSIGGSGGAGYADSGDEGTDGTTVPAAGSTAGGQGGLGGSGTCEKGSDGADGADGAFGRGGRGIGSISAHGWEGAWGSDGEKGAVGHGGGGGGGVRGRSTEACSPVDPGLGGPSGGSGGGGGCGGKAGTGGGPGGASIGVLAIDATLNLDATTVRTGAGGHGGRGGIGQEGGFRYRGGAAGRIPGSTWEACDGGDGGKGGHGGIGGGGVGGPSIAIAYANSTVNRDRSAHHSIGALGEGGPGGDPAIGDAQGESGLRGESQDFPHVAPAEAPPR
jgi:hypothetical protein